MNTQERSIIHLNVADFAVAVERLSDCRLRQHPVIIAPEGAARAVVFDMSEEAYQQGVRKGMPLRKALRHCRDAMVLPPHTDRYERAMTELLGCVRPYSPLIEVSDYSGHLFIDVTGTRRLFGPPPDVAWRIRKTVRKELRVDPIWAVAPNKLISKVATRLVKPVGEYIIGDGDEQDFLKNVPLHLIPGIETDDLTALHAFNLTHAGQVAKWTSAQLEVAFGVRGSLLYNVVRGTDTSPVLPANQTKTGIRLDHEFGDDTNRLSTIEQQLYRMVEQAGAILRRNTMMARRTGVVIDYSDGKRIARQAAVAPPTTNDFRLYTAARIALERAWIRRVRIRHLRLICDRLIYPPLQMELFADPCEKKTDHLLTALDHIRGRFGFSAVQVGRTIETGIRQTPHINHCETKVRHQ